MKINPMTEAMRFVNRVREKPEDSPAHQQKHKDPEQDSSKDHHDPTFDEVTAAVEAFAKDEQARANGLQAAAVGSGPGLRIVLKDGGGAVVRQFTGEEFLRLREAGKGCGRGKILDQKL